MKILLHCLRSHQMWIHSNLNSFELVPHQPIHIVAASTDVPISTTYTNSDFLLAALRGKANFIHKEKPVHWKHKARFINNNLFIPWPTRILDVFVGSFWHAFCSSMSRYFRKISRVHWLLFCFLNFLNKIKIILLISIVYYKAVWFIFMIIWHFQHITDQ